MLAFSRAFEKDTVLFNGKVIKLNEIWKSTFQSGIADFHSRQRKNCLSLNHQDVNNWNRWKTSIMAVEILWFTCQNCLKCILVNHNGKQYKASSERILLILFTRWRKEKCCAAAFGYFIYEGVWIYRFTKLKPYGLHSKISHKSASRPDSKYLKGRKCPKCSPSRNIRLNYRVTSKPWHRQNLFWHLPFVK